MVDGSEQLFVHSRPRICRNLVMSVARKIPNQGRIEVEIGQHILPEDILGVGIISAGFRTIPLARELRVSPDRALFYLRFKIGQTVYEGELLARKEEAFGLKKKLLISPADGVIEFYDHQKGDLRIKLLPKTVKTISGVYGIVEKIDVNTGAVIVKTFGNIIYGVFGSGREREGILQVIGEAEELVSSRQINESMRGKIVVGGGLVFLEALEKAMIYGVSGIISGGINARDYKSTIGDSWDFSGQRLSDVGVSLLVTEGFGSVPIGEDIFPLLKISNGQFAILDGNQARLILPIPDQNSMMYIQKAKASLDLSAAVKAMTNFTELQLGAAVRVVGSQFLGTQGVVESIDRLPTRLPSGVVIRMVTIAGKRRKIRLPYSNLEVLG